MEEHYAAGQASFEEVREEVQQAIVGPKMEPKVRDYLMKLRQQAFLQIKEGYVDTGAAPGKDTRWQEVAQLKPATTTKEEVLSSSKAHKKVLGVAIPGTTAEVKTLAQTEKPPKPSHQQSTAPGWRSRRQGCRAAGEGGQQSPDASHQTMKSPYVSELEPNKLITTSFLVHSKEIRQKKSGELYLSLLLADRTGELDAKMWDNVAEVIDAFDRDDFVRVKGLVQIFHNRPQMTIHKMRRMDDSEIDFGDYFPSSRRDPDEMWLELRGIVAGMANPHLKGLLEAMLDDEDIARRYRRAPAAKTHSPRFSGRPDRARAFTVRHGPPGGAALQFHRRRSAAHRRDPARHRQDLRIELRARLLLLQRRTIARPHPYRAADRGREAARRCPDFPPALRSLVEHMILSHHGKLEFGSPKVPQFPEALMLHYLDDMDSKMECMRALIESDRQVEGCFTAYNVAAGARPVLKKDLFLNPPESPKDPPRKELPAMPAREAASPRHAGPSGGRAAVVPARRRSQRRAEIGLALRR